MSAIRASYNLNAEIAAARKRLKEDYHLVGYPTESESGSCISCIMEPIEKIMQ